MSNDDVSDFLFGGGAKAFQFNEIGDICRGTVVKAEIAQQTSMEGEPLTWPDGRKRMQLVVTVQTDQHDDDDDDGIRTLYAKGGRFEVATGEGMSMKDAIADAMKSAKAKSIDPGDEIAVGFTGVGKATQRGYSAPKLYAASFRKGRQSVKAADLFGEESPLDTGV